jgi:uncharacterized protein (DUF2249 family)
MLINPQTKISVILKANPKAVDAIASISPHFEKLRNPILRKVLASRVTIADAARIGNSTVDTFFEKLKPLGFERENGSVSEEKTAIAPQLKKKDKPADMPDNIVDLDVRAAIETGNDPFNLIMDGVQNLQPNQALKLINTFEPTPLLDILSKRGYQHFVEVISPDLVNTYFYKTLANSTVKAKAETKPQLQTPFEEIQQKYDGLLRQIDVRNLEMPLPMTTILETLEVLKPEEALFVLHKKVPQFLLPQLAERGFAYTFREIRADRVDLIIYPNHNGSAY